MFFLFEPNPPIFRLSGYLIDFFHKMSRFQLQETSFAGQNPMVLNAKRSFLPDEAVRAVAGERGLRPKPLFCQKGCSSPRGLLNKYFEQLVTLCNQLLVTTLFLIYLTTSLTEGPKVQNMLKALMWPQKTFLSDLLDLQCLTAEHEADASFDFLGSFAGVD